MDLAVKRYRKRRKARLKSRMDDEEENNNNGGGRKVSHGNTKLPFGLCQRYGIEIGKDWTPKDAWDALAGKGVTPGEAYKSLSGTKVKSLDGKTYDNVEIRKSDLGTACSLYGDIDVEHGLGIGKKKVRTMIASFTNKDELMSVLSDQGIKKIKDPETGKIVDPTKMDLPRTVAKDGYKRYSGMYIDAIPTILGAPEDRRYEYVIIGKDFSGNKSRLKRFKKRENALAFAKSLGCKDEDLKQLKWYKRSIGEA